MDAGLARSGGRTTICTSNALPRSSETAWRDSSATTLPDLSSSGLLELLPSARRDTLKGSRGRRLFLEGAVAPNGVPASQIHAALGH